MKQVFEIKERDEITNPTKGRRIIGDVLAFSSNVSKILTKQPADIIVAGTSSLLAILDHYKYTPILLIGDYAPGQKIELEKRYGSSLELYENAPSSACSAPVEGKRVVLKTNNGSEVVNEEFAKGADEIFLMSFLTMKALSVWLRNHSAELTLFVPAGERSLPLHFPDTRVIEDRMIAETMYGLVTGLIPSIDDEAIRRRIEISKKTILATYPEWPTRELDIELIFDISKQCDVVPQCVKGEDRFIHIVDAGDTRSPK